MTRIVARAKINAPPAVVFDVVANFSKMPERVPDVIKVEFVGEQTEGVGTRFVETRRMKKGKEMLTELEVTEMTAPECIRIVTDSHGTVWDTLFEVDARGETAELVMTMDARAHALLPRLLNPIMKGFFRRGIVEHLAFVKQHCESDAAA